MAEEVFSVDTDRAVLKDEPLLNGLSELQTKQVSIVLNGPSHFGHFIEVLR